SRGEGRERTASRSETPAARTSEPVAGVELTEARRAERAEARAEARRRRGGRSRTRRRNGEVVDG
ncbi:ATP-dependent helicase, partial [Thiopseudomonas sp. 4R-3cl]